MTKQSIRSILSVSVLGTAVFSSCVNPDYDLLTKELDRSVTVLSGVTVPIGSFKPLTLREMIGTEQVSALKEDADGNLSICIEGDPVISNYTTPQINLGNLIRSGTTQVQLPVITLPNVPAGTPEAIIPSTPGGLQIEKARTTWQIAGEHTGIPKEIKAIYSAATTADLSLTVRYGNFPIRNLYVSAGSKINLPASMVIDLARIPAPFHLEAERNVLVADQDFAIPENGGKTICIHLIGADFTELKAGQGLVAPGHFKVDDELSLDFKVYAKTSDIHQVGSCTPTVDFTLSTTDVDLQSITCSFAHVPDVQVAPVAIEGLPDFLSDATVDLENLRINLTASNPFALGCTFVTTVTPLLAGQPGEPVAIGPLSIPASGTTNISLSEKGKGAEAPFMDAEVPGLDQLVYRIPDELQISKPEIIFDDEPCTVAINKDYRFSMDFEITAPLTFGKELDFQMDQDIAMDLNMTEQNIRKVILKLDAVNTLPFDFQIHPIALDAQNNIAQDIRIHTESVLKAGTLASPTTDPIRILLESDAPIVLSKLRLSLKASCSKEVHETLNMNQALHLTRLRITLPDGISNK